MQAHNKAHRTHLSGNPIQPDQRTCPRGCAALHPSSLRFAPGSLRLTGRGSAAASLLQTRSAHHDRAVAPRRLLSPAPLSLKTVCCAAAAGPRALPADPVAGGRVHGISPIHRRCAERKDAILPIPRPHAISDPLRELLVIQPKRGVRLLKRSHATGPYMKQTNAEAS